MKAQLPYIVLGLADASGSNATMNMWIRAGSTAMQARSGANLLTSVIAPLSGAVVTRQHTVYRHVADPRPVAPAGGQVARMGVFIFTCSGDDQYAIVQVPAIKPGVLMTTGPGAGILLDLAHPDVDTFIQLLRSGFGISGNYINPFGQTIDDIEIAYMQFRP